MRYKDFIWPENPETYGISFARRVAVHGVPFGTYAMQESGRDHRVMTGEGAFTGKSAYDDFKRLACVFYEKGPGTLVHPVWQTTSAYFVTLALTQEPLEDYVRYRFAFWEAEDADGTLRRVASAQSAAEQPAAEQWITVAQGDTLWGIARRCGVTLQQLVAANPQIKNPNLIRVGEKVRIP